MKLWALISELQKAQVEYGDLPVSTTDSDIEVVSVWPCVDDGLKRSVDGVTAQPTELVIDFHPAAEFE